jgi:hypothetical protein
MYIVSCLIKIMVLFELIVINSILNFQKTRDVNSLMVNENKFLFLKMSWTQQFSTEMRTADPDVIQFKKGELLKFRCLVMLIIALTTGSMALYLLMDFCG